METRLKDDIQIEEDAAYQRKFHVAQRLAWVLMSAVIATAAAGFIGPGLIGMDETASSDGLVTAEYDGTVYFQKDSAMTVIVRRVPDETVSVWFSRDYIENVYVKQMLPPPAEAYSADGKIFFFFKSRGGELRVSLYFQAIKAGRLEGKAGYGSSEARISQFVFP